MPTGFYPRKDLFSRVIERVIFTPDDCWEWQGGLSHGYGRVGLNNKTISTHKAMFEMFKGPVPSGMFLCHHCDNPKCCNPDHLFLGTQADNMKDCAKKKRHVFGERSKLAKLSNSDVAKIRQLVSEGVSQKDVAKMFNVSVSNISKIMTGASRRVS